jgi:hypothetical protein
MTMHTEHNRGNDLKPTKGQHMAYPGRRTEGAEVEIQPFRNPAVWNQHHALASLPPVKTR